MHAVKGFTGYLRSENPQFFYGNLNVTYSTCSCGKTFEVNVWSKINSVEKISTIPQLQIYPASAWPIHTDVDAYSPHYSNALGILILYQYKITGMNMWNMGHVLQHCLVDANEHKNSQISFWKQFFLLKNSHKSLIFIIFLFHVSIDQIAYSQNYKPIMSTSVLPAV